MNINATRNNNKLVIVRLLIITLIEKTGGYSEGVSDS